MAHVAAQAVLLAHLGFIVFAVLGAALALRWRWMPWIHVPAAAWAFYVEAADRACPLTTLENHLLQRAGEAGYAEGFVAHYLVPLIYPAGLTRELQATIAGFVVVVNVVLYVCVWMRRRRCGAHRA